jgi:hypothetical protein
VLIVTVRRSSTGPWRGGGRGPGERARTVLLDGMAAGAAASVPSGLPSTILALAAGRSPLQAPAAAGSLALPREERLGPLLLAAIPVHVMISLAWGTVLAAFLPTRRTVAWGAATGAAIAVLDLRLLGRRLPRIRTLPFWPQLADHVAFGAIAGMVVAARRASRQTARPLRVP